MAVLYRTNAQSRQIEEALRRYGRKYIVVGGFSFYQRAEVKDILAYLKALVSPQDSISLLRIINTPARGIGRTTVEQIEQYALTHEMSLWTALGARCCEERAFPGARRGRAERVPSHDGGDGRRRRGAAYRRDAAGGAREDRLPQRCSRKRARRKRRAGWATWTNCSTPPWMRPSAARPSAISWITRRWSPTPIRSMTARRFRC